MNIFRRAGHGKSECGDCAGQSNPVYYSLASAEYGNSGDSACNSTLGNGVSSACVFYDVTQGDIDVNCNGTVNCYLPSGNTGVLYTSNSSCTPAFAATIGWDFATGLGTVNATNLANSWPISGPNFSLSASPNNVAITQGGSSNTAAINTAVGYMSTAYESGLARKERGLGVAAFTLRPTIVVWLRLPEMPVTVTVAFPVVAVLYRGLQR